MKTEPVVLGAAVFSLTIGLVIYAWLVRTDRTGDSERTHLFSWLLVALFPVLLIFSFFPQSEFSADIKGATMGGAVGAFIFIWWYGTQSGLKATKFDELRAQLSERNQHVEQLEEQLQASNALQQPQPVVSTQSFVYVLTGRSDRRVVVITGDIRNIKNVDVWVNSENTDMQMSRFHERSISGVIRYEGARHDPTTGRVVEDCIANELSIRMGANVSVEPGTAIITGPGELATRNNVMAVVHVAAVQGTPGMGYRQVENLNACVRNTFIGVENIAESDRPARSVVFPLLGTGEGGAGIEPTVKAMVGGIVECLNAEPPGHIDTVYLLAYTDAELAVCRQVLAESDRVRSADQYQKPRGRSRI
jgi:O-acetyl-ADP-ribose deacetylase (regulator of RNase III)